MLVPDLDSPGKPHRRNVDKGIDSARMAETILCRQGAASVSGTWIEKSARGSCLSRQPAFWSRGLISMSSVAHEAVHPPTLRSACVRKQAAAPLTVNSHPRN